MQCIKEAGKENCLPSQWGTDHDHLQSARLWNLLQNQPNRLPSTAMNYKAQQGSEKMTTDTSLPLPFVPGPNTRAGPAGTNCWMLFLNALKLKKDNTWTLACKPLATENRYCTLLLWCWHLIPRVLGVLGEALLCPAPLVMRMRKKVRTEQDREKINKETTQ